MTADPPAAIALVPDLMDRSRVAASVPGARFVGDPAALTGAAHEAGTGAVVLVDLERDGALAAASALAAAGWRVVGFASHVDAGALAAARAAGVDAHPRSKLFRSLPDLLAGGAAGSQGG